MAVQIVKVPDIGEGIAEVELVEWHVKAGDTVVAEQVLADVMTDKATVEVPSLYGGRVISVRGSPGDKLAVGSELLRIETDANHGEQPAVRRLAGEAGDAPEVRATPPLAREAGDGSGVRAITPLAREAGEGTGVRAITPLAREAGEGPGVRAITPLAREAGEGPGVRATHTALDEPSPPTPLGKPLASPSVRRHARELGVDLRHVRGSGPDGRIRHEDLERPVEEARVRPDAGTRYAKRTGEHAIPVIGLRRQIANRMREALRIPHFTYVEEIDVTELEALRARLNDERGDTRGRLTLLPFLMRAIVLAVPSFPQVNARYDDEQGIVTRHDAVHIGVAAQTGAGLMVPVVRHAEALDLWAAAAEIARLANAARTGKATRGELGGSTITITSLGPLGGIATTPVINPPEVAIVGVGRIVERPAIVSGAIVPRKLMNLSSSFDHRVVDGSDGARFVQALRRALECPALMFVD